MLAKTAKGTEVSVHFIEDCEPNKGGWDCEIYLYDEDGDVRDDKFDDFTIYPDDCREEGCINGETGGPTGEAEEFAREFVLSITEY